MIARLSVAILVTSLLAPVSGAFVADGCPSEVGLTVCKQHGGTTDCPGSASEFLLVTTSSGSASFADSTSCDGLGSRSSTLLISATASGSPTFLRWTSNSGSSDYRDITLASSAFKLDWSSGDGRPCQYRVTGPATLTQGCILLMTPGMPVLNYGRLLP